MYCDKEQGAEVKKQSKKKTSRKSDRPADRQVVPRRRVASRRQGRVMSEMFPALAKAPGVDEHTARDLLLTEAEFGAKYRKGRNNRLVDLENLNTRLAYDTLIKEHSRAASLLAELDAMLLDAEGDVRSVVAIPRTLNQASAVIRLWFLSAAPGGCRFETSLSDIQQIFKDASFDDLDIEIAREVVLAINEPQRVQELADQTRLTRQSVYLRIRKITERFDAIAADTRFAPLVDAVRAAGEQSQGMLRLPLNHPLISIATMRPAGPFGNVVDIVRVAIFSAALATTGDAKQARTPRIRTTEIDGRAVLEVS
jgi:hypothetical protein